MEENLENPKIENPEHNEPLEEYSVTDAITGVITEPVNAFNSIKSSPVKHTYWLIPVLILIVISIASRYLVVNDDELFSEIKTKQIENTKKSFDEAVQKGSMSQDQENEKMEQVEKSFNRSSFIFNVIMIGGPIITIFLFLFLKGLIFFGALKIFKGAISYMQVIIVLGLSCIIDSIQTIVDSVLAIITDRLQANIGPILIFPKEALSDKMTLFTAHFDLFNIWYFIIISIGFAIFSGLDKKKTVPIVFVLWLIWVFLTAFGNIRFIGG